MRNADYSVNDFVKLDIHSSGTFWGFGKCGYSALENAYER